MSKSRWQFAIDVGGTFTDCLARRPDGKIFRAKLLSTAGIEAPIAAIRSLLGIPDDEQIPPIALRLGTTRGTNALLTRTGANAALVMTQGFGDILKIGYQDRPRLFDLTVRKLAPLTDRVVEISERVSAEGEILVEPDAKRIRAQLVELIESGVESLAICLLHADLYPDHELLVERIAKEVGYTEISRSSAVAPLVKLVSRSETTVVDAYLNPVLRDYLAELKAALPGSDLLLMTSSGGLTPPEDFHGHESVLSGPAGGVVGYARVATAAGFKFAIGFDMGGTSTDVSRYNASESDASESGARFEYEFEAQKAGVRLMTPTLAINTVAAGGGSICRFDGVKLCVGPESAGADPGPACYGRGGPLCVTDVNLFLGRLPSDGLPFSIDRPVVDRLLRDISDEMAEATGERLSPADLAEGLLRIANANMAGAIRNVTVAKGADPSKYALVAFGGAAGQHACAVAQELGIRSVLIHPDAGLLSARGISWADVARHDVRGLYKNLQELSIGDLERVFAELSGPRVVEFAESGFERRQLEIERTLDVRYVGVDATLNLPFKADDDLATAFAALHQQRYGYVHSDRELEIVAARTSTIGKTSVNTTRSRRAAGIHIKADQNVAARFGGRDVQTPVFARADFAAGDFCDGPAIVVEAHSTIVVDLGWRCELLTGGEFLLSDREDLRVNPTLAGNAVMLEVFNNLLAGIAERMGHVLRQTAGSVNVKERLDYSCAVFTGEGMLVANAPHVPVHLGAMGATVRSILADNPAMQPDDLFVTNNPYRGGSHLPDVTVVLPVHDESTGRLRFFTACRAHHAEIGGVRPGSMPPMSTTLGEEGVVISNFQLVAKGQSNEQQLRELLAHSAYPTRNIKENLADIRAQVAAAKHGANDLHDLIRQYTVPVVERQMRCIQDAAETKVRAALEKFAPGVYDRTDALETAAGDSAAIAVQITIQCDQQGPAAVFDFTGSSPVVEGNLNANPAIVHAAVLYVLRLLVAEDIPLNEGATRAVDIRIPPGILNPVAAEPIEDSPAVAAGNVETSQRVVDVLLGALGLAAASQGTMNNVLLGNENFGYYETIAGGSGATDDGPGADAVQVHMTNTRSTDPEILERRVPVRLWESSIRRGSGGAGRNRGGDGVTRRMEFLAPLDLSLITQRRGPNPPFGLAGGQAGKCGENRLVSAAGNVEFLPAICQRKVEPGDVLIIETPGGGGYGPVDGVDAPPT